MRSDEPDGQSPGPRDPRTPPSGRDAGRAAPRRSPRAGAAGPRRERVADAAVRLISAQGLRGLTHRAVDTAAGLPAGATSNVARTRAALLELALRRVVELELAELGPGPAPGAPARTAAGPAPDAALDALAATLAELVRHLVVRRADRTRARLELALEATRRPELRSVYDALGADLRAPLVAALAGLGSAEPERHARSLTVWLEGRLFYHTAGAGAAVPPSRRELEAGLRELLAGMLRSV